MLSSFGAWALRVFIAESWGAAWCGDGGGGGGGVNTTALPPRI